jgi:hypothetical protein
VAQPGDSPTATRTPAPAPKPATPAPPTQPQPPRTAPDLYTPPLEYKKPAKRPLQVYAFDPTLGHHLGNQMTISVRYEDLEPGPVGARFAVVDYDGSTGTFNKPVNLDDPKILICGGLDPTESDPRFHQQMVYAVASETLERFEAALGRRLHWRYPQRPDGKSVPRHLNRLYLFPHAMVQANAFYDPDVHGILFGYFRASETADAQVLPGQTIFTCLSHDIIAHETTHAIVDGIRGSFMEPTNVDVLAFHEAFADLAALFRHFSHREVLLDTLKRTGGRLYESTLKSDAPGATVAWPPTPSNAPAASSPSSVSGAAAASGAVAAPQIQAQIGQDNPLIELARQFGQVSGLRGGLRSALGTPANARELKTKTEPHARGAILVAAVFDAYFSVYMQQTADLFRVFRAGGGSEYPVDLPGPLATLLATEASRIAELFFSVCARALDYCPPIDITFGDFLRALITADIDLYPTDSYDVRDAVMQAFRSRGIVPNDAMFFSEDALRWPSVDSDRLPAIENLIFGDPNGLMAWEKDQNAATLLRYATDHAADFGFGGGTISVPSFHPTFRTDEDGALKIDMVVQILEQQQPVIDASQPNRVPPPATRSGVTLIIAKGAVDEDNRDPKQPTKSAVRYAIVKHLGPKSDASHSAAADLGLTDDQGRIDFASLHGGV